MDSSPAIQTPSKGNKKAMGSKPGTPATSLAKGKPTPTQTPKTPQLVKAQTPQGKKTPQMKKTPQAKTPPSSGKGGKKTPQKPAEDDDDDEEDDDEDDDFAELEMDSDDDDDDDDDDSLEEDMDDDDEDEGNPPSKPFCAWRSSLLLLYRSDIKSWVLAVCVCPNMSAVSKWSRLFSRQPKYLKCDFYINWYILFCVKTKDQ